ncbi:hypothetical protein QYM36_014332 [Artemia franciscana]|uniref:Uncharacterized protein n=1 Tax=Artemia franciscana TaxID=6661 RepID=A0AA88HN20_ARTSF|nr:hypothetical protein QYM36_014332 [Artemia franciscana]
MDKMKIQADLLEKSKEFQELCDHLKSWLPAKDKMMGVLCPAASDPPAWKLCKKFADDCDDLSIVKGDVEEALKHVDALQDRLKALWPLLAEVDAVGNELCHIISDTGSVVDVTAKIQQRCEDRLSSHDALGDTGRDSKILERMKAILEETKGLDQKLVALDGTAQALVYGAHKHGSNVYHIGGQAEAIRGRYADLHQPLEERCAALEVTFGAAAQFSLFERERKLDEGLLQSRKFREALDSLAKWLSDTKKKPSADYKVVKAQLQEQKLLKKRLFDGQHSMSALF